MVKSSTPHKRGLQRIARQEARIAKQKAVVAKLKTLGMGSSAAERLLQMMENALAALRFSHRRDPD